MGTDGEMYRQLVKGGDDMRQDAVMEQVGTNATNNTPFQCSLIAHSLNATNNTPSQYQE